ncbi:MAG TPA: signal peptidase I [Acidimicrobiales bacterium]|nr:signal peptidase I [Acidimicrobiales bacterium]
MRIATTAARLLAAGFLAFSLLLLLAVGLGPRTGAYRTVTVLTGSMRPTMAEGSVIVTTPVPARSLRVGDVITYRIPVEDRRVVTHRVVEIVRGGDRPVVRTKGDANASPDGWVAELKGGTVWKVRATVPQLGWVLEWLRRPQARQLLVLGVPLLSLVLLLRDIWRRPSTPDDPAPSPASPMPGTVALLALLTLGAATGAGRG